MKAKFPASIRSLCSVSPRLTIDGRVYPNRLSDFSITIHPTIYHSWGAQRLSIGGWLFERSSAGVASRRSHVLRRAFSCQSLSFSLLGPCNRQTSQIPQFKNKLIHYSLIFAISSQVTLIEFEATISHARPWVIVLAFQVFSAFTGQVSVYFILALIHIRDKSSWFLKEEITSDSDLCATFFATGAQVLHVSVMQFFRVFANSSQCQ